MFRHRARTDIGADATAVGRMLWQDFGGKWDVTGNWDTATVPINGDTCLMGEGTVDVTLGLDQSAVTLARLHVGPLYDGDIATEASPLLINAADVIINKPYGQVHLNGTFARVIVMETSQSEPAVTLDGNIAKVYIISGNVKIADSASIGNVYCTPGTQLNGRDQTVQLDVGTNVSDPTALHAFDMTDVRLFRKTRGTFASGSNALTMSDQAVLVSSAGAWNDADIVDGTWQHTGSTKVDGVLTLVGHSEFTLTQNDEAAVTVDDAVMYPGCVLDLRNGAGSAIVTNFITYFGGHLAIDAGRLMEQGVALGSPASFDSGFDAGFFI
jgi:hypothetical protein